jgi:hypothetical protein
MSKLCTAGVVVTIKLGTPAPDNANGIWKRAGPESQQQLWFRPEQRFGPVGLGGGA